MKFPTQYTHKNDIFSCAGTKVVTIDKRTGEKLVLSGRRYTYKQERDDKGKRHLVISDTEDVYNKIQSYKDDTDIYKIVARYFNGDISALDKNKGFYADITQIPKDINEWQNKIEEGRNIFAGLPTDLKREFGNDLNQFITSLFNKDFDERYNKYIESSRINNRNSAINSSVDIINNSNVSEVGGKSNE